MERIEPAVLELAMWLDRWIDRAELSDLHVRVQEAWFEHVVAELAPAAGGGTVAPLVRSEPEA